VFDDAASESRVYVDGVLVASGTAYGVPKANTAPMHIGARMSSSLKDFLVGAIDDVRITPGALYTANFVPQAGVAAGAPTLVRLQWQAPVSGGPAVGYDIFRSINNGPFAQINLGTTSGTSFIDASLQFGNLCYYVKALNAQMEAGAASSTTCETVAPPGPPAPSAPTDVTVILAGSVPENAVLTWSAPEAGAAAIGYLVYRAVENNPYERLNAVPITTTSFTDTALLSGTHCYQVSAVDTHAREGALSTAQCLTYLPPPPPLPAAPTDLTAVLSTQPGTVAQGTAAWTFDELNGQSTADATGNGNLGRLGSTTGADANDPLWAAGVDGNSLLFDGSNDYVEIPDSPHLRFAGSFTIEAWIKRASAGTSQVVLAKGDSDQRNYWMRIGSSGIVDFRWEGASGSNHGAETKATVSGTKNSSEVSGAKNQVGAPMIRRPSSTSKVRSVAVCSKKACSSTPASSWRASAWMRNTSGSETKLSLPTPLRWIWLSRAKYKRPAMGPSSRIGDPSSVRSTSWSK
jgi:hypothetical protein